MTSPITEIPIDELIDGLIYEAERNGEYNNKYDLAKAKAALEARMAEAAAAEIDAIRSLAGAEERANSAEARLKREAAKHYEQPWTLTEKAVLEARCAELESALEWYGDRARDLARDLIAKRINVVEAIVTELSLDAGTRARSAIAPAPGEGESK